MESLIELNKSAYQYNQSIFKKFIQTICPLSNLGINYFCYFKLFRNGKYLCLINNLNVAKAFFSTIDNQGYFTNIWNNITETGKQYNVLSTQDVLLKARKDPIIGIYNDFKIYNLLFIYEYNGEDDCIYYCFGTSNYDTNYIDFYFKRISLLERFITYFSNSFNEFIDTSDKDKLGIMKQIFHFHNLSQEKKLEIQSEIFLSETRARNIKLRGQNKEIMLTPREVECIEYMLLGHSMKSVANILDLSPRIVETYLQNAKQKTGYTNKSDLLNAFIKTSGRGNFYDI